MTPEELERAVLASRKYKGIHPAVVRGVCLTEHARHKKPADALKAVKRRLHMLHAAYAQDAERRAEEILSEGLPQDATTDKEFSHRLLPLHRSTAERIPFMDAFYALLRSETTKAASILDIGCGFHPFALPYMELMDGAEYTALDISVGGATLLNRYFAACPGVKGRAIAGDATADLPSGPFDLAFVFKLLPLLEQQKKGAATELLARLPANTAVITFPVKSLSGREKGMAAHYSEFLSGVLPDGYAILRREQIGNELIYITSRAP